MSPFALRLLAVGAVALVLQAAVGPHVNIGGVFPELLLAVTISGALAGGSRFGVTTGFVGGLAMDALNGLPLGLSALAYGIAAIAVAAAAEHASDIWWATAALAFGASVVSVVVIVVAASVFGYSDIGILQSIRVVFVVGSFNAVLVPLVTRALGRNERRRELAW